MQDIFLDLDMTLNSMSFDWCTSLGIMPKDVLYYGWIRDAFGPNAEAWWATPGIYNVITPLPGAEKFVENLAKNFRVRIITHTHKSQNPKEKEDWISKHFRHNVFSVIHASEKFHFTSDSILVDDCPRHIHDHIRHNDSIGILFNYKNAYGWSIPLLKDDRLVMASSYEAVLDIVNLSYL